VKAALANPVQLVSRREIPAGAMDTNTRKNIMATPQPAVPPTNPNSRLSVRVCRANLPRPAPSVVDGGDLKNEPPDRARVLKVDLHGKVLDRFGVTEKPTVNSIGRTESRSPRTAISTFAISAMVCAFRSL